MPANVGILTIGGIARILNAEQVDIRWGRQVSLAEMRPKCR